MNIAICLPFWRKFDCLKSMLEGIWVNSGTSVRFFIHVTDPAEDARVFDMVSAKFPVTIVSRGQCYKDMAETMNALFNASEFYDWCVFTEQDVFMYHNLSDIIRQLNEGGICIAGPLDTMMYDHPNAKSYPLWGDYGRLSPKPGYFHSSLIFIKRTHIGKDTRPFTIPDGMKLHGWGVLGGESYYGLRINHGQDKTKLSFFRQLHSPYGYAADIWWEQQFIATHLYYSSTKEGYRDQKFLSEDEYQWLVSEERRFLKYYSQTTTFANQALSNESTRTTPTN